jgi:hypothetical protein
METPNKIEWIKSWVASIETDEQLSVIREYVLKEFDHIPEELRNAIDFQKLKIEIKNEYFIYSVPTLAYYF